MDDLELTELFVERRKAMERIAEIDGVITPEVLERGKTFSAAGVSASYYKASVVRDYELAAQTHPEVNNELVADHTKVTKRIAWKKVCDAVGISEDEVPVIKEKPARVVVK